MIRAVSGGTSMALLFSLFVAGCAARQADPRRAPFPPATAASVAAVAAVATAPATPVGIPTLAAPAVEVAAPAPWQSLFDGQSLGSWQETPFSDLGSVKVERGELLLLGGDPLTGVTWAGAAPPRMNYEIALEAKKVKGGDFFCALTFPVGEAPITLVVGGWGGTVVGLSSLDDRDASENETTRNMTFTTGRWYAISVRVRPGRIEAFIDGQRVVDVATGGKRISIRPEVAPSVPLGIATFNTTGALREIKIRPL